MLIDCVNQAEAAQRLLERARAAAGAVRGLRSGDRVYTPLVASAEFDEGAAAAANLIFNVPADADFWAYRFLLYPYCKVVDPIGGTPPDVSFRPTSWTGEPFAPGIQIASRYSDFESQMDAVFAFIFDGKEIQNANIPASAAYCVTMDKWGERTGFGNAWEAALQTPAGLVFDIPQFIPRSRSFTARVTPTYLGKRTIDARKHRYKVVGVLEGEKRAGALR
jgi:hypothetical protein